MEIAPLQRHVVASEIQPERLAGNSQLTEREKIGEASRQFEAILVRQILQSSQKTVIQSKFADNSTAAGIYHDLITNQLADSISKSGAFGLAKTFEHQLNRPSRAASMAGHDTTAAAASPTSHADVVAARPKTRIETHLTHGKESAASIHRSIYTQKTPP